MAPTIRNPVIASRLFGGVATQVSVNARYRAGATWIAAAQARLAMTTVGDGN